MVSFPICSFLFIKYLLSSSVSAQQISTTTPVPALQWLNLTGILASSSAPPPLRDASIGYDPSNNAVIIFGGQSSSGIATSKTFILNLQSLTWSSPTPQPFLPQYAPPARYMAISGDDFSSSYRQGHLVIGGRGADGPLGDAWEFDFINNFWSEVSISPGGPLPRWGASGGRDARTQFNAASTNNTFYMAGGTDGTNMYPLSDVWEFQITGTLSSNLVNNLNGSWNLVSVGSAPGKVDQGSTMVTTNVVSVGGCNTPNDSNIACAQPDSHVIDPTRQVNILPPPCPPPRYGATVVPNLSQFVSSFSTQVFVLFGTFDSTYWNDQGGSQLGEVDVLDISTGAWSRILPSGDPGTTGIPAYPSPRQGAVAISAPRALVGNSPNTAADTLVFGGVDESGTYLSEVWLLRAYNASITQTNGTWGGPDGELNTGVSANGAGVTIQYMTQCAVDMQPNTTGPSTPTPTSTRPTSTSSFLPYDVSLTHKLLAPLSIGLLLPAIILLRMAMPAAPISRPADRKIGLFYLSGVIAVASYGAGIGGLISSFTSISSTTSLLKRASNSGNVLRTAHGVAGLVLVIALYAVVPFLSLLRLCYSSKQAQNQAPENTAYSANSIQASEKLAAFGATQQSLHPSSAPSSPRARLHSWGTASSHLWLGRRSRERRVSADSESVSSAGPQRAFEVVNRPTRTRRASAHALAPPITDIYQRVAPRSLGDVDWLDRRRSLNAVNELDCATSQAQRGQGLSTPIAADRSSTRALMLMQPIPPKYELPSTFDICLHVLFHALVLALCVLSLLALWYRAPMSLFVLFLAWTCIFYCLLFALAWHGRPKKSVLTSVITRLRAGPPEPTPSPGTPTSRPLSMTGTDQYLFPTATDNRGPYLHQPPYRQVGRDDHSTSQGGPRSVETDDDDEDDEDTRQRRMEEEMGRREVSIVTVPKRKLWITNPS